METQNWFAVATKPGGEYTAETELRRVGIAAYLPQYRREYRHHRSKAWIVRKFPLFQGYIFIPADDLDWGAMMSCDGIAREGVLRCAEGKPVPIPDQIIARIHNCEARGEFDDLKRAQPHGLFQGETVLIADGPLSGMQGPLSHVKSARNVRLLVTLFNREVEAVVPVSKLQKTKAA